MKGPVKDQLKRYGLFAKIGPDYFFPTIDAAVRGYVAETGVEWGGPALEAIAAGQNVVSSTNAPSRSQHVGCVLAYDLSRRATRGAVRDAVPTMDTIKT